eukprot:gnl/TRDRNA2_/TRDRNA2_86454_c0_seq4.p1 gnl/TRDRNA2_/TRDRNA2_86454_c0~~gnl/TRDRNA2_/TRDRNA2_86454_c0_seq4.p1  ORF type:complete len:201 (+),score=29.95 gnl/TRDRNA2_/TRDRNA2_86454_c0_seq4:20-622(+)
MQATSARMAQENAFGDVRQDLSELATQLAVVLREQHNNKAGGDLRAHFEDQALAETELVKKQLREAIRDAETSSLSRSEELRKGLQLELHTHLTGLRQEFRETLIAAGLALRDMPPTANEVVPSTPPRSLPCGASASPEGARSPRFASSTGTAVSTYMDPTESLPLSPGFGDRERSARSMRLPAGQRSGVRPPGPATASR